MKIQKQNWLRILSVVLVIAMLALNSITMLTPGAAASSVDVPSFTDPDKFNYVYYEPTKDTGIYLGDHDTTSANLDPFTKQELPGNDMTIRLEDGVDGEGNPKYTKARVDALKPVVPTLSNFGEGVDGSFALKFGTMLKGFSEYRVNWRWSDANRGVFVKGTSYTIEMKVKKVSGKVDSINAQHYLNNPEDWISKDSYTDADLKTDEWTTLTFTETAYNPTKPTTDANYYTGGRWMYINLVATEGAVVLIDDIKVYATEDASKTNMFLGEYLQVERNPDVSGMTYQGSALPGTFDADVDTSEYNFHYYVPTDDTGIYLGDHDTTSASLDPFTKKELPGNDMTIRLEDGVDGEGNPKYTKARIDDLKLVAPSLSNPGEGIDGSFALKFGTMLKGFSEYRVHWRWADAKRSVFKVGTSYTIEMKVKKVSGKVDSINAQQYYNNPEDWISKDSYTDADLKTDEWTTLTFTETAYNPNKETTDSSYHTGVRYVYLNLVATEGAVVLIDDIKVYATDDASKTNIFCGEYLQTERNPDVSGMSYTGGDLPGTFDIAVVYPNHGAKTAYAPTKDTGIYLGDHDTTSATLAPFDKKELPGNDMIVKVQNGVDAEGQPVLKRLMGDDLKAVAPSLSADGQGLNGSYALKFGTTTTGFTRYMANWRWMDSKRFIFQVGTSYTVEMKVKKLSGKVDSINAGLYINSHESIDFRSADNYTDADITTNSWTTLTFTAIPFNPAKETTDSTYYTGVRYMYLNLVSENGAEILVDDITVYATDDAEKTELFLGEYLQTERHPDVSGMTYTGPALPGTFDERVLYSVIEVEEDGIDPNAIYLPEPFYFRGSNPEKYPTHTNAQMLSVPVLSALGEGFNDTYGIKMGDASTLTNSVRMMTDSRQAIAPDTEYTINFKVTLLSGKLSKLQVGVFENGEGSNFTAEIDGTMINSGWKEITVNHITNSNTANWKWVEIAYEAEDGGAVIVIDEISVHKTADPEKNPIQFTGMHAAVVTCEVIKAEMNGTPVVDNTPEAGVKYVPIKMSDWAVEYSGNKVVDYVNGNFPAIYENSNVDKRVDMRPRISALGEGVKGSYALVLGDKNVANVKDYAIGFRWISTGALLPETNYTFKIKLRKEGVIDRFTVGIMEAKAIGERHNAAIWSDNEISTSWQEYTFNYTTDETPLLNWNYLMMSYESAAGGQLYIDDVKIYETEYLGDETLQKFSKGSFEYKDLGQVGEIVLTDLPSNMKAESMGINPKDQTGNGNVVEVKNYIENSKHNAVLAIGFGDTPCEFSCSDTIPATKPGGTYKVSFRVLVKGEVEWARVGVIDSFRRNRYYMTDYDFNQYQNGKWTTVEYIFRDTATYLTGTGYRGFMFAFKAPAGSGMLIDDLSVTYLDWEDAPNSVDYGSFSSTKPTGPALVWSDIFTYKEEK